MKPFFLFVVHCSVKPFLTERLFTVQSYPLSDWLFSGGARARLQIIFRPFSHRFLGLKRQRAQKCVGLVQSAVFAMIRRPVKAVVINTVY